MESSARRADFDMQLSALANNVAPEDMSYLQQRHLLLDKQWGEMKNQLTMRKQRLTDQLDQWGAFSQKYTELCDWLTQAEGRLGTLHDYHIEELIFRMQHVSQKIR